MTKDDDQRLTSSSGPVFIPVVSHIGHKREIQTDRQRKRERGRERHTQAHTQNRQRNSETHQDIRTNRQFTVSKHF